LQPLLLASTGARMSFCRILINHGWFEPAKLFLHQGAVPAIAG
jgi:hypothetical protein